MALEFPSSPTENDIYTQGGKSWVYKNGLWTSYGLTSFSVANPWPEGISWPPTKNSLYIRDDFMGSRATIASELNWTAVSSTGGALDINFNSDATHPGIARHSVTTSANSYHGRTLGTTSYSQLSSMNIEFGMRFVIKITSTLSEQSVFAGWSNVVTNPGPLTSNEGLFWRASGGTTNWEICEGNTVSIVSVDSGVSVTTNWIQLMLYRFPGDPNDQYRFCVNNFSNAGTITTRNTAPRALKPILFGIQNNATGGTVNSATIDLFEFYIPNPGARW